MFVGCAKSNVHEYKEVLTIELIKQKFNEMKEKEAFMNLYSEKEDKKQLEELYESIEKVKNPLIKNVQLIDLKTIKKDENKKFLVIIYDIYFEFKGKELIILNIIFIYMTKEDNQ